MLDNGADPYSRTEEGLSLLHLATETDAIDIIFYFKENYRIGINEVDNKGSTPLHQAVFEGSEISVSFLIAWGANINAQDSDGHTPLHLAVDYAERESNSRIVKLLLLKGADKKIKSNKGKTPRDIINQSELRGELLEILADE